MQNQAPATANATDFDFVIGQWDVTHRRLVERLAGCTQWIEFSGYSETRKILGGAGNIEDNVLELPQGTYRAAALRSFDPATGEWAIWWLDDRSPGTLDTPVRGRFSGGVGLFYADDNFNGQPIRIRFKWALRTPDWLRWEQAFSPDAGESWETNWTMDFARRGPSKPRP